MWPILSWQYYVYTTFVYIFTYGIVLSASRLVDVAALMTRVCLLVLMNDHNCSLWSAVVIRIRGMGARGSMSGVGWGTSKWVLVKSNARPERMDRYVTKSQLVPTPRKSMGLVSACQVSENADFCLHSIGKA